VARPLAAAGADRFRAGVPLPDGTELRPVQVELAAGSDRTRARLTLREGKNRQIRRMAEACGLTVVRLHRIAIGQIRLGTLAAGAVRSLTADEVRGLERPS